MRWKRRVAHPVPGAVAAGFLLLSAWGAPAPFDLGDGGNAICASAPLGGSVLFGGPYLRPGSLVVVQDVRLLDPSGLELLHAWVIPAAEGSMGTSDVPPADFPPWVERGPAEGAVLAGAGEQQVLVELARTAGVVGEAQGLTLSYASRGHVYITAGPFRYSVRDACF